MKLSVEEAQDGTRAALRVALERFMADNPGVTQGTIERAKGMTPGTLSQELGGHYPLKLATVVQSLDVMEGEYLEPLFALCGRYGTRPVSVGGGVVGDLATVHATAAKVLKECAEAVGEAVTLESAGQLSKAKRERVVKEIDEALLQLDALRGAVLAVPCEKRGG